MKKPFCVTWAVSVLLAVTAVLFGQSTADEPKKAEAKTENKLVGTWKLIKGKYNGKDREIPGGKMTFKHVTPAHSLLAIIDKHGKILAAIGGPYTLKGETYVETPEYGLGDLFTDANIKGKPQSFPWKVEGNRWYHNGTLSNGVAVEEVWERVELKGEAKPANKLVGTWKEVFGKFGGKEVEFPQGLLILKHVTPTHVMWMEADKDGKLIVAFCGPYTLKEDKYVETFEYALGDFFLSRKGTASDPLTSKVEGNKWQIKGKALHGVTLEEVWERVENASGRKG